MKMRMREEEEEEEGMYFERFLRKQNHTLDASFQFFRFPEQRPGRAWCAR